MIRKSLLFVAIAFLSIMSIDGVQAGVVYSVDDGTGEQNFGDGATAKAIWVNQFTAVADGDCLLYTSPSPRDLSTSRMPSSA